MKYSDIPQFTRTAAYKVNVGWGYLETMLYHYGKEDNLDLNPDFQRAHVWTKAKQQAYVEFCLRGGKSSREIFFNSKGWMVGFEGPMVLVDGKQRLEAVRRFLRDDLKVFGHKRSEFEGPLDMVRHDFIFYINDLETRAEVLQWYLDLNTGGVVHTNEEIEKVKRLLEKEKR